MNRSIYRSLFASSRCLLKTVLPQLLAILILYFYALVAPCRAEAHPYTGMVSFGDSFSDTGNINGVITNLGVKDVQYLTGFDPGNYFNYYGSYRFSNGPVWVDYLYMHLGLGGMGALGPNDGAASNSGTNFSSALSHSGSGVYKDAFPNLLTQVASYSTQLANGNPALPDPETTLFTLWSGTYDLFSHLEGDAGITPESIVGNISTAITTLYAEGGRAFLVPNLQPIGLMPRYINDSTTRPFVDQFVNSYNSLLDSTLDSLSESLTGARIIKLDVHDFFHNLMEDPYLYGFTNVIEPAYIRYGSPLYQPRDPPYGEVVPNPDGYFYWDTIHGTSLTNALIAEAAFHAVIIPEPSSAALLMGMGFALYAMGRFRPSGPPCKR